MDWPAKKKDYHTAALYAIVQDGSLTRNIPDNSSGTIQVDGTLITTSSVISNPPTAAPTIDAGDPPQPTPTSSKASKNKKSKTKSVKS